MISIKPTKGSFFLFLILALAMVASATHSFYKFLILRDYWLYIQAPCDPLMNTCFVHDCEPEDVRCNTLPEGKFYYKILSTHASNLAGCEGEICIADCFEGERCKLWFCSEESLAEFDISDYCST